MLSYIPDKSSCKNIEEIGEFIYNGRKIQKVLKRVGKRAITIIIKSRVDYIFSFPTKLKIGKRRRKMVKRNGENRRTSVRQTGEQVP